jgi:hypothetical protein
MPVAITGIHPVFVGEVSGIDLREPVSEADVAVLDSQAQHQTQ